MRLMTVEVDGRHTLAVERPDGRLVDLGQDTSLPAEMVDLVAALSGDGVTRDRVDELVRAGDMLSSDVPVRAPIRPRNNVMCVGKNYRAHAAEFASSGFDASAQQAIPDAPVIFTKALSSIAGPGDAVLVSRDSTGTSDYEGELGVVIGRGGTSIAAADAWDHVFGYTIVNDLTVRELQKKHVQFFVGKSAVTYCPMGPAIVTRDEVPDVEALWVRTRVNGEERQAAPVAELIFSIPVLIEAISRSVLLEPGDVIATGTPAGVGIGRKPIRENVLHVGDTVRVEIERIGELVNTVVEEPEGFLAGDEG